MLTALEKLSSRTANWPAVTILLLFAIACNLLFEWRQEALGYEAKTLDSRGRYTLSDVQKLFAQWGPDGCRLYAATQVTLDVVFPIAYGGLFLALISRLYRSRWPLLLPAATVVADLLENFTTAYLAWSYDTWPSPLAWAAAAFTAAKSVLFVVCLLLLLFGAARGLFCVSNRGLKTQPEPNRSGG
jgi:hypothetical protein